MWLPLLLLVGIVQGQIKILLLSEQDQPDMVQNFTSGISEAQAKNPGVKIDVTKMNIDHENEETQLNSTCLLLAGNSNQFSLIVDLTWGGWSDLKAKAEASGFPYVRLEAANHQFVKASDDYLRDRGAADAALIFENEPQLDQGLYYLIGNSFLRTVVLELQGEANAMDRLAKMRPAPSYCVAYGSSTALRTVRSEARKRALVKREARWTFVFQDWNWSNFFSTTTNANTTTTTTTTAATTTTATTDLSGDSDAQVTILTMDEDDCCAVLNQPIGSLCNCAQLSSPSAAFVKESGRLLAETLSNLWTKGWNTVGAASLDCTTTTTAIATSATSGMALSFKQSLNSTLSTSRYLFREPLLTYPLTLSVSSVNSSGSAAMGTWETEGGFRKATDYQHKAIPRFFRIGTVPTKPWAYQRTDPLTGKPMTDKMTGRPLLDGYCVEMVQELSIRMFFDYELIIPTDNSSDYGQRDPITGKWSGVIGDLVNGEIDLAVAGMTMTSEREEVVDFVAPYFDQSGISIIIRRPVRARSLFKFLEVLRVEVWLAILASIVVTALMLWFLDFFSPYSAQNNRDAHPYPCRIFTLRESFWFALTAFTPQGGGESPKSMSGRVLVAAYWLFVVLMLATFTANLAAFLTVERMQSTVHGLDELAQQSKINYTVVQGSPFYEYFQNMANAEEDLYRVWKELTLGSSDQAKYRVWDYPIKEQYTHIFKTIKTSGMVKSAEEGFQKVLDDNEGTFAFIHDASQVRYEYYNNCNFTEVGEPFAEQPYAVAVQQGSHLQEEISRVILELQKDRYFETLSGKYWNNSLRGECPTLDDSEGITLTSLGGVFIATLVGLALAMVALAAEVYVHRKKEREGGNKVEPLQEEKESSSTMTTTTNIVKKANIIHVGSKEIHI